MNNMAVLDTGFLISLVDRKRPGHQAARSYYKYLKIDHLRYGALIRYMTNRFDEIAADIRDGLYFSPMTRLKGIVRQVLPPDDSSL